MTGEAHQILHPLVLYGACAVGALGVGLALPRREGKLWIVGMLLAAIAGGAVVLAMSLAAGIERLPSVFFYMFAAIALGAGLRMITHPRPVYSALYFILTIIATAGLLLLLSAEFMAFALVIIYAGAILITYLFVIMLATQAPTEKDVELQAEYDVQAREPWVAAVVGFVVLGILTGVMARGVGELPLPGSARGFSASGDVATALPRKVERALRTPPVERVGAERVGADGGERVALLAQDETLATTEDGMLELTADGSLIVEGVVEGSQGAGVMTREIPAAVWRDAVEVTNVERLGMNLLGEHPMTIEIAGVILLMAMLGATVLARKHVELEEMLKAKEARRLHDARAERTGAAS